MSTAVTMALAVTALNTSAARDNWWNETLPSLENETDAGPSVNPFKEQYWEQFNGPGPNHVTPPESPH